MVTIKNKANGKTIDVANEVWNNLRSRSRKWTYVGPAPTPKPKFVKKEVEKTDFETE